MHLQLHLGSLAEPTADGLVLQVDGAVCVLGSGAARALKESFPPEDRRETFADLEAEVKRLRPLTHGEARLVPGDGKWEWLVIVAAVPHNVNDRLFSPAQYAAVLRRSITNAVAVSVDGGLQSIAMTTIGTAYRMPSETAVASTVVGLHAARKASLGVYWCFLDRDQLALAEAACDRAAMPYDVSTRSAG